MPNTWVAHVRGKNYATRYFASRDDLLTALIADAFSALADTLEQARASAADRPIAAQLLAATLSYPAWALAHPFDFQMTYT